MESEIALRRTNTKHWQARLSCSRCLPPCSSKLLVIGGRDLDLTLSTYDSYTDSLTSSKFEVPLDSQATLLRTEDKIDKQTEVRSEYQLGDKSSPFGGPPEPSRRSPKPEKRPSKSDKRGEKKDSKSGSKKDSKPGSKTGHKPEPKAGDKPDPKSGIKVEAKPLPNAEPRPEEVPPEGSVSCAQSRSPKSVRSCQEGCPVPTHVDPCLPPCFEEKIQEVLMGNKDVKKKKTKPPKQPKPPKPPKPPKESKLEKKSSAKTKSTKPKPKEKEKKKKPEKMKRFEPRKLKNYPTLTQIGGSVNHNCCSCLDAISIYIKEFLRFSCSLTTGRPAQDTEFQERVCDLLNILRTMCRDCFYLVRYVARLLFVD